MNQEQYYLNQDLTSECIQLPNLFSNKNCLLAENYLNEFIGNTETVLNNLGLTEKFNALNISINEIINQIQGLNGFIVEDGHSTNMDQLLTQGIYRNCTSGRPVGSANGEHYTCVVIPVTEAFEVCSGILLKSPGGLQEGEVFLSVNIENLSFLEFYSNNDTLSDNKYIAHISTGLDATILLSVAPSRANKALLTINGSDNYPSLGIGTGEAETSPLLRFNSKHKVDGGTRWNYERNINTLTLGDLRTFEVRLPAGIHGINITSDSSRYYNWWVFDARPACGYTPILQICFSQTRGRVFYRMLYTKDNTKFVFPDTLYGEWRGSATEINSIYLNIEGLLNDIDDINNQLEEIINDFDFKGLDIVYIFDPIESITPSSETMDKIYLRLRDYGFNPDGSPKMETYNGYVTRKEVVGSPDNENTVYKWVQISQCLTSDEIQELIDNSENNYILKNDSNNQGTIDINCDSFNLSSSITFTDDSEFIKYNGETILSSGDNNATFIYSPNDLYHNYEGGSAIIYDSHNFNADTLKIYKSNDTNDIIKNNTSFKNAVLSLEEAIMNLPPGGSGECQCELPEWVTDEEPEFGDKNKIEYIKLNNTSLTPDNTKTVTIQIGEGLTTINNSTIKHDTNSEFEGPVNEEKLYKIKFDKFGHITGFTEFTSANLYSMLNAGELFNMLKSILDNRYEFKSNYTQVTSVTIAPSGPISLGDNDTTETLTASTNGTNQEVTWTSSNSAVATVDSNGVVTAVGNGTATITATSVDNTNASNTVTVNVSFATIYYFSVGTDSITVDNYRTANNATTNIPESTTFSSPIRTYGWIVAPDNKTVTVVNNNNNNSISITEQTSILISNLKVYKTNGALSVGGTIKITLS